MVIEVYVDTTQLANNQALIFTDDVGKRWDVADALHSSAESSPKVNKNGTRYCETVLERWTIELGDRSSYSAAKLNDLLPNVYKKGVVLFRSLYTYLRFLPTWRLYKRLGRHSGNHQSLKLKYRIREGQSSSRGLKDTLYAPLCPDHHSSVDDMVEHHVFDPLLCPGGPLSIRCDYRASAAFGVADSESLLSSRFLGQDEGIPTLPAGRSLPGSRSNGKLPDRYSTTAAPTTNAMTTRERPRGLLGAYGSLGTFHATDKRGSPVTELKQRAQEEDDDSDEMERIGRMRREGGMAVRRPSVNFLENPPFKSGSLASSPRPSPSPGTSAGKHDGSLLRGNLSTSGRSSKRTSLNALPQQALRAPPSATDIAVVSPSSASPKPAPPSRYSSSFANRPRRLTSQSSKGAESTVSSGRGSTSSKEKSGQLGDGGGAAEGTPGSSGSARTDEDDIAAFLSALERTREMDWVKKRPGARDATVNLARFSVLRDPSAQLADEMSASSLLHHTSITPPSRRLSNVPGLSTSSSPSRALAHAPHVRSRLSTHSIVEESGSATASGTSGASRASGGSGGASPRPNLRREGEEEEEEDDDLPFAFQVGEDV